MAVVTELQTPIHLAISYSEEVYVIRAVDVQIVLDMLRQASKTGSLTINFAQGSPRLDQMQWREKHKIT